MLHLISTIWTKLQRIFSSVKNAHLVCGIVVVLLVTAIGVLLTLQGWKSRTPAFDLLTYIHSTRNFLETGTLPQHGDTGSYGNIKPPGTAWLMVPSALMFADPRLSEYVGTACLYLVSLLGLFLLVRVYFGIWCAYLSVILYGLSHHGLFFAGSLWPNGRPDFYIWIVFLTTQWVIRKDAKYLAAAVTVWGIGMHVDMAIAPAFFILPAVWLLYRPPLRLKPLLVGGVIALTVWYPYLRFEAPRGFADIKSMLLLQNIFPANYRDSWCDPSLTLLNLEDTSGDPMPDSAELQSSQSNVGLLSPFLLGSLMKVESVAKDKLLSNFEPVAPVPGASIAMLLLVLSSLVMLSVSGFSTGRVKFIIPYCFWSRWLTLLAVGMILSGILANEFFIARYLSPDGILDVPTISSIRRLQAVLVLGGIFLLTRRWIAVTTNKLMTIVRVNIQIIEHLEMAILLVISLVIPWFILLLVAEPGKPERFWWLWPLQVIFLVAFITNILPRIGAPRTVVWIGQILLIFTLLGNPFLLSRVDSWLRAGWAGTDAEQVQVVDYVASQLRSEGKDQAAIGYQTIIYRFMAAYNITNPEYKVGAEFDLLFKYRHGITNINLCAEGISSNDEYRIVQTKPESGVQAPREYFNVPLDSSFHMLRQFETYQVFKRN